MSTGHFKGCNTPTDCWCEVKRYYLIFGIAAIILIAEIVGGIASQSLALLADAGHVLTDTVAILVAIIVGYCVKRGNKEEKTRRIGGYINTLLLGGVAIWIAVEAVRRLKQPEEIVSWMMLSIAVLGTIGNLVQHKIIGYSDDEHVTHESMRLHILSDLIQSLGVVFGGMLIWITGWILIDPIISMIIALWMGKWTWQLFSKLWTGKYDDSKHPYHNHHNNTS